MPLRADLTGFAAVHCLVAVKVDPEQEASLLNAGFQVVWAYSAERPVQADPSLRAYRECPRRVGLSARRTRTTATDILLIIGHQR